MVVTPSAPSTLLKLFAHTARALLVSLLVVWFLFIFGWFAIHALIVPRISELRPFIETQASQLLGIPVKIGAISAESKGIFPSLEISDVILLDSQGQEALRLPRVFATLSPRSLWNMGFEQLYIDRPELEVRRNASGAIFIAGLDFSNPQSLSAYASDWFFSQNEFVIHEGTLIWKDELRQQAPLKLDTVNLLIHNKARNHTLRLQATPPPAWGERFALMADFRQPFLTAHPGKWRDWEGQIYSAFDSVNLSQLRSYADLGVGFTQGHGVIRAWLDVNRGSITATTADVSLSDVEIRLKPELKALALPVLSGRLSVRDLNAGIEVTTRNLQFEMSDGRRWPGGNIRFSKIPAQGTSPERGQLSAERLDLTALSMIASRLEIAQAQQETLLAYQPKGIIERLDASWQGPLSNLGQFEIKGRVSQLELLARTETLGKGIKPARVHLLSPGMRGATIDFDLSRSAGRASLLIQDGHLELPGLFDESVIPLNQLSSDIRWQSDDKRIAVQMPNIKFSNSDTAGDAQLKWQSAEPQGAMSSLGQLDLQGTLSRGQANRIHRYLPVVMDTPIRDYLRMSLLQGEVSAVKFKVKGNLDDLPFKDAKQGEFRISASAKNLAFTPVPRSLDPESTLPWPILTQVSGDLLIDRNKLQIKEISARIAGAPGLRVTRADASIADFMRDATVRVNADARGPLSEMVATVVNGSPLGGLIGNVLAKTTVSGSADYQFSLAVPIATTENTTVQGRVVLTNSDIQVSSEIPRMSKARGTLFFNEKGFAASALQARMLGGDIRADGGTIPIPAVSGATVLARAQPYPALHIQGNVTSDGLKQATELGTLARLAQHTSGGTSYSAVVGLKHGVPEVMLMSNLQGLALNFPAPLNKVADEALPLRLETMVTRVPPLTAPGQTQRALQDQIKLDLGLLASVIYVRDVSRIEPRVLRGSIALGLSPTESAPSLAQGVSANINFDKVDLDAWASLLSEADGKSTSQLHLSPYVPTSLAIRAKELTLSGRTLNQLVVGGSRDDLVWRANLDARELNGYLEFRQPSPNNAGQLFARLARLSLGQTSEKDVESFLDEQPTSIPALDIVVDDMELRGKKMGRVEIEAVNRGQDSSPRNAVVREWRLNKFNVITPEAVFSATGNWAFLNERASSAPKAASRGVSDRRRTVMNFKLDIADAGELLARFGMKDVIRKGKGRMEGQMAWLGSPLALDYPTLGGSFLVNVENGQFLKADPGIAKLFGVLSLQALPRRLSLDFRDVFSEGFSFDFVRGDVGVDQGIATTNNLQMKGVNAAVLMEGRADIARETQSIKVVVVPEINAGTASLIATWINPTVGLGTFLAQLFLRRPLMESATQEFLIDGSWTDPKVTRLDSRTDIKANTKGEGKK
jgi:uncharacterized protein (TIGR02099 family)